MEKRIQLNFMKKIVKRKAKDLKKRILELEFEILAKKNVERNNEWLLRLFEPLLLKLSKRYSVKFKIPFNLLFDEAKYRGIQFFQRYDFFKNDNFPSYFKYMLDRYLLFFCEKHIKDSMRVTALAEDFEYKNEFEYRKEEEEIFNIATKKKSNFLRILLNRMKDKNPKVKRVFYLYFFKRFNKSEVAKLMHSTAGGISYIVKDFEEDEKVFKGGS